MTEQRLYQLVRQPPPIADRQRSSPRRWASSGFANTDLDFRLRQHGTRRVIVVGVLANTCIESTSRFAMELGCHVTLVRDATAAYAREMMRASHELNGPTFAHAIVKTKELVAAISDV